LPRLPHVGAGAALAGLLLTDAGLVRLAGQDGLSRLSRTIQAADAKAIRALLASQAEVRASDADGTTPLHWAVRADDLALVRSLLRAGARAHVANRYGASPLSLAVTNGNAAMTQVLLAAGAQAEAVVARGQTVLMTAARAGNADVVRMLLDKGATVDAREDQQGETALMWAASENHAAVVALLAARGADVNARSKSLYFPKDRFGLEGVLTILPKGNWTPLMYAARDGAPDAAKALIAAGADVNATDPDGTTPLIRAIWNTHYDTAKVIIEAGANVNLADASNMGALYAAVDMSSLGEVYGMPPRPVRDEATPLDIIALLLARGAEVDARLKSAAIQRNHTPGEPLLGAGTTPLMRAARNGDVAAMKLLIAKGASATLAQPNGTTVLMLASGVGRGLGVFAKDFGTEADLLGAVQLLLANGAAVNAANTNGLTALHFASQAGLDSVVSELARHGAVLDVKDKQGRTPVDVALGVGNRGRAGGPPAVFDRTAALLQQLGAPPPSPVRAGGPGPRGTGGAQ
jgi:ankyrin repeat protein